MTATKKWIVMLPSDLATALLIVECAADQMMSAWFLPLYSSISFLSFIWCLCHHLVGQTGNAHDHCATVTTATALCHLLGKFSRKKEQTKTPDTLHYSPASQWMNLIWNFFAAPFFLFLQQKRARKRGTRLWISSSLIHSHLSLPSLAVGSFTSLPYVCVCDSILFSPYRAYGCFYFLLLLFASD